MAHWPRTTLPTRVKRRGRSAWAKAHARLRKLMRLCPPLYGGHCQEPLCCTPCLPLLLVWSVSLFDPCMGAIVKNLCVVLRVFPSFWFGQFLCSTLVLGPLSIPSVFSFVSSPPFGLVSFFVRPLYGGHCQEPLCCTPCLPLLLVWSVSLFDPEGRFSVPTCLVPVTPRTDAVKDGRRFMQATSAASTGHALTAASTVSR